MFARSKITPNGITRNVYYEKQKNKQTLTSKHRWDVVRPDRMVKRLSYTSETIVKIVIS